MEEPLLLQALKGKKTDRPPIWMMRQAGRYLPEYREIRLQHSMLEVIKSPELASQVTLQPLERFELDAAIIFADILNPLIGMGMELDFVKGEGPKIFNPIQNEADVDALRVPAVEDNVGYTLEAIDLTSKKLGDIPLIGFCGAPFTLSAYMIEGEGSSRWHGLKTFMLQQTEAWKQLQEKLCMMLEEYLVAQAKAGARVLQIFDSWVSVLGPADYQEFVAPYLQTLISRVRERSEVPVIYFAPAAFGLYPLLAELEPSAFGVDWRVSLTQATEILDDRFPLQGNLDPCILLSNKGRIEQAARAIVEEGRSLPAHIFNLGHGMLPGTPVEHVAHLVECVRSG